MNRTWLFGSTLVLAGYWFYLGLKIIMAKRPFVYSSTPFLFIVAVSVLPALTDALLRGLSRTAVNPTTLLYGAVLVICWKQMNGGFTVVGANGDLLRDALHRVLNRLGVPFEEKLSKVLLTSLNAELDVTLSRFMGSAQLQLKGSAPRGTLRKIALALQEDFGTAPVGPLNRMMGIWFLFVGTILAYTMYICMFGTA